MSTQSEKPYVVLAPHVDDEVIGCYRVLQAQRVAAVYYKFDLTFRRVQEALRCAKAFDFDARVLEEDPLPEGCILLVPSSSDWHPHHRYVNHMARELSQDYSVKVYSVDMNIKVDALGECVRKAKKAALLNLFPSQKVLFAYSEKFWLFEVPIL